MDKSYLSQNFYLSQIFLQLTESNSHSPLNFNLSSKFNNFNIVWIDLDPTKIELTISYILYKPWKFQVHRIALNITFPTFKFQMQSGTDRTHKNRDFFYTVWNRWRLPAGNRRGRSGWRPPVFPTCREIMKIRRAIVCGRKRAIGHGR